MKKLSVVIIYLLLLQNGKSELLRPENGTNTFSTIILFEWTQIPEAKFYNLVVAEDSNLNNEIINIFDSTLIFIASNFNWNFNYYWTVYPIDEYGDTITIFEQNMFSTGNNKMGEIDITFFDSTYNSNDLIIFSSWLENFTCVIDKNGNEIWNDGNLELMLNFINDYGQLFGINGKQFNMFHEIVWQQAPGTLLNRHDLRTMENGNIYGLRPVQDIGPIPLGWWTDYYQSLGYLADGDSLEYLWTGEKISVIDRGTKQEIWFWNPFDYYSMEDVDLIGNTWWWNNSPTYDWLHSNSIFFNENESAFYISHRHISRITKVSYPSGEILWMMGLPEPYMASGEDHICTELLFSWQHDAKILANGNLLFFDNGNFSETYLETEYPTSRVIEVSISDDLLCEPVWVYELEENLYSQGMGSVQELSNGNLLVSTMGDGGTILEINREKQKLWEAKLNMGQPVGALYRAFNIKSIFPNEFSILINDLENIEVGDSALYGVTLESGDDLSISVANEYNSNINIKISVYEKMDDGTLDSISNNIVTNIPMLATRDFFISIDELSEGLHTIVIIAAAYPFYEKEKQLEISINITEHLSNREKLHPEIFNLNQYPNPFNNSTKFNFHLNKNEFVQLKIYDILGREIIQIVNTQLLPGNHSIKWETIDNFGAPVPTGIYIYKFRIGENLITNKMLYLE